MNTNTSAFVAELIEMYSQSFINPEGWIKRYKEALNDVGTVDYEKLWKIFNTEYEYTKTPPSPAWIKKAAIRCKVYAQEPASMKTITAVDLNGVYEFVCEADYDINKLSKKFLLFWEGGYYSCPADKKPLLEQLTKAQREKITGRRTA